MMHVAWIMDYGCMARPYGQGWVFRGKTVLFSKELHEAEGNPPVNP